MAQLRQRRVERPARHSAARRQCQALVQPPTLAWRRCGHRGIDNARPPGPFACASPRRQEDEKAAAAAALGRGAAIFLAGSTHRHAWHRVAVPACPAPGCRAAKGGREHGNSAELLLGTPCAALGAFARPRASHGKKRLVGAAAADGRKRRQNALEGEGGGNRAVGVQRCAMWSSQTCFFFLFLAICNCEQRPRALHPARPLGAPRAEQEQPFTPPWGTCSAGAQDAEVRGARRCCAGNVLCAALARPAWRPPGWAARRPPPRRSTLTRSTRTCNTPARLPRRPSGAQPN